MRVRISARTTLAALAFGMITTSAAPPAAAQETDPPIATAPAPPPDETVVAELAKAEAATDVSAQPEATADPAGAPQAAADATSSEETAQATQRLWRAVRRAVSAVQAPRAAQTSEARTIATTPASREEAAEPRTAREAAAADLAAEPEDGAEAAPADDAETADAAQPTEDVRRVTAWVAASGDNAGLPFVVIDKVAAEVFVFDAQRRLLGAAPALLGLAPGDDSPPGIGDKPLKDIGPEDRITPAGRFVAAFGPADHGRRVLWVDYDDAVSLHPVVTANKKERRLERLFSPTADDNRITYGCINIPAAFYENLVGPLFAETSGVVYILPDTKSLDEVFPTLQATAPPVQSEAPPAL